MCGDIAYKVVSVELMALMIRYNADLKVRYCQKTALNWAMDIGDKPTATLLSRASTMLTLCEPRAVKRLGRANTWVRLMPTELLVRLSQLLFPPLFDFNRNMALKSMLQRMRTMNVSTS